MFECLRGPAARPSAAIALLALGALACREELPAPRPALQPAAVTERALRDGRLVGGIDAATGAHVWRGIPYAAPPVGALRWRAPQPAAAWSGTREALASCSACPQRVPGLGGGRRGELRGSEDCLYLDLYAPAFAPDAVPSGAERLPVMVWIHGGGNTIGEGGSYDGSLLATGRGVLFVSLNYRLGPLGWFRHAALRAETSDALERSGNFANLDQILALGWVRDNIAAFGGDPGNVTVFGESAGGANVIALLIAPPARGLFQRAIVQSGGIAAASPGQGENYVDDLAEPGHAQSSGEVLAALLVADGSAADRAAARALTASWDNARIASHLRGLTPEQLIGAYPDEGGFGLYPMPKPFRDGVVLPSEEPALAIARGDWNRVPVILGSNRDETRLFSLMDRRYTRFWFGVLPRLKDATRFERDTAYGSKLWKASAVDELARAMRSSGESRVFAYRFDWDELATPAGTDLPQLLGAAHGLDLGFVFGSFERGALAVDFLVDEASLPGREALADAMTSYWTEFARQGDPGRGRGGLLPAWTAWDEATPETPRLLVLDSPQGGGIRMSAEETSLRRIVDEIGGDPRFASQGERCAVLLEIASRNERVVALGRELLACDAAAPIGAGG